MEKTTVYLTRQQKADLASAAAAEGRSEARLIRDGVDAVTARHRAGEAPAAFARDVGEVRGRGRDVPSPERPRWIAREDFVRLVLRHLADAGLRAELRRTGSGHHRTTSRSRDGGSRRHQRLHRPRERRPCRSPAPDLLPDRLAVSVITVGELRAGVLAAADLATRDRRLAALTAVLALDPVPVGEDVAAAWARPQGRPPGPGPADGRQQLLDRGDRDLARRSAGDAGRRLRGRPIATGHPRLSHASNRHRLERSPRPPLPGGRS